MDPCAYCSVCAGATCAGAFHYTVLCGSARIHQMPWIRWISYGAVPWAKSVRCIAFDGYFAVRQFSYTLYCVLSQKKNHTICNNQWRTPLQQCSAQHTGRLCITQRGAAQFVAILSLQRICCEFCHWCDTLNLSNSATCSIQCLEPNWLRVNTN